MTGKGKAMEDVRALGNVKATEKVNQVIQDKGTDIAESLAQGEDRGGGVQGEPQALLPSMLLQREQQGSLHCVAGMRHLFKPNVENVL
jgi:hypothetical protein